MAMRWCARSSSVCLRNGLQSVQWDGVDGGRCCGKSSEARDTPRKCTSAPIKTTTDAGVDDDEDDYVEWVVG